MTDRPNEEREALVAGDRAGTLEPVEAAELGLLAELLASSSTWEEPGPDVEGAVLDAVLAAEPAVPAPPAPAVPRPGTGAQPRRTRRALLVAIAAAAAIAIVVTVVTAVRRESNPEFKTELTATALAPGAHGTADMYGNGAGFRIDLDATGLPRLPDGRFYQAWLENRAGVSVPVGTFSSSDGTITLWSGVSPQDFPTLTVTVERAGPKRMPTGQRVLAGEIHAS